VRRGALALVALLTACAVTQTSPEAVPESRHEGYYYPAVNSTEVYDARARTLEDSTQARRLGFIAVMLGQQLEVPYPPAYLLFAKGDQAEKLIIVGLRDDEFGTLYRARAHMASLTTIARQSPLFQDLGVEDSFTFYDLATLLGFREIVLSDGRSFAHRIRLR